MEIITQFTEAAADTAVTRSEQNDTQDTAVPSPEQQQSQDTAVSRPEQQAQNTAVPSPEQQAQNTAVSRPEQKEIAQAADGVLRELYLQQERRPALTRNFYRAATQTGLFSGVWVDVAAAIEKLGFTPWGEHIIENLETDGMITIDASVGFEGEPAHRYHLTNRALAFMDEVFEQEEQARRARLGDDELALARRARRFGVTPDRLRRWDKIQSLDGLTIAQIAEREGVEAQTIKKDKKDMRKKGYTYP